MPAQPALSRDVVLWALALGLLFGFLLGVIVSAVF